MKIPLPPIDEQKSLSLPHFPTGFQAVIFRNWGLVPVDRIAAVIGTDVPTVCAEAALLGFDPNEPVLEDWLTKGYITIIRSNWHILDYDGICTLLQCSHSRLAYLLQEDDFLSIKLGRFKPAVRAFGHRALTEEEALRTREICAAVTEIREKLPPRSLNPFAFEAMFQTHCATPKNVSSERFEERYCYSYCALYGDTFADRELIDQSFPDELLRAYQNVGITGVWTHIVLYTVTEFPFAPEYSEGFRERQAGMRYLTEKLARYGLKLFLYFNEPRTMPMSFFETHPELFGWAKGGFGTLCTSVPAVCDYLKQGVYDLVKNVPLLGGFFTITASENMTNCFSHEQSEVPCPRCAQTTPDAMFATVNRLVLEGARAASDSIKVIAWSWGWISDLTPSVISQLPEGVAVMGVSEQAVKKDIGGTCTSVLDYSLSVEGPGQYALSTWKNAHEHGLKGYAKMQVNNTWEMAAVPYIPAFEKPYRHLKRLIEAGDRAPDGLMLSWSLGGYPSPIFEMFAEMYDGEVPEFSELIGRLYPDAPTEPLCRVLHAFSEAFDKYPFHINVAYNGPQHYAPANLFFAEKTGFSSTMVGFPYDDIDGWRAIFPVKTYVAQLKLLSDEWTEGMALLRTAVEGIVQSPKLAELVTCAEACDLHFRAMYLNCIFVLLTRGEDTDSELSKEAILTESEEIAFRIACLCNQNPTIGYESSNHYFYTQNTLLEKILNCRFLLANP